MNEKIPTRGAPIEFVNKSQFAPEDIAGLLARHIGDGEYGPVGRPVHGFSNAIFRFTYNGEPHFIRLRSEDQVQTQTELHSLLDQYGIPNASVVKAGFDNHLNTGFVIQKKIDGEELWSHNNEERADLFEKAGPLLRRIHGIKLKKFGRLNKNKDELGGEYDSWQECFKIDRPAMDYLLENELIPEEYVTYAEEIFNEIMEREVDQGVLLHNDFHAAHVFAEDGQLTGVIDWDSAMVGDPMYDLAVSRATLNDEDYQFMEQGYGEGIDYNVVNKYTFLILLKKIAWRHKNNLDTFKIGLEKINKLWSEVNSG